MFHYQSWNVGNPFILGSNVQKVKVTRHKNIADMGHGTFVGVGFFYLPIQNLSVLQKRWTSNETFYVNATSKDIWDIQQ